MFINISEYEVSYLGYNEQISNVEVIRDYCGSIDNDILMIIILISYSYILINNVFYYIKNENTKLRLETIFDTIIYMGVIYLGIVFFIKGKYYPIPLLIILLMERFYSILKTKRK